MRTLTRILCVGAVCLTVLSACKKEYYDTNEPDLKTLRMEAVGALFENIARQPESAGQLIKTAEETIYASYTALLPLTDAAVNARGVARGNAIGSLLESIARQPEARATLEAAAEQFLGTYDDVNITAEMNKYAKAAASPYLTSAIARQPEMAAALTAVAAKYLGPDITTN